MTKKTLLFLSAITFILSLTNIYNNITVSNYQISSKSYSSYREQFNYNLYRINSICKLENYIDSIYGNTSIKSTDSLVYANIASNVIRERFYHGWAKYTWKNNWILYLINSIHPHSMGIVEPNDILKFSEALCSQQSIVAMEFLKKRGFNYQKIGFYNSKKQMGHFSYEIILNDGSHYYDVNLEPNKVFLDKIKRPSIESLIKNKKNIDKAYDSHPISIREDILPYYFKSGRINEFPAKKMLLLHKATQFISYYLWAIIFMGYLVLYIRKRQCVV